MPTISEALTVAIDHHRRGRLQAAEEIYRQILMADRNQAEAHDLLGGIAHAHGKHEVAIKCIGRPIALNRKAPAFHNNLAKVYRDLGQMPQAIACGEPHR